MSIYLTQLATDSFNRANVNPLTSPWTIDEYGDPGMQIVSDACEPPNTFYEGFQSYAYANMPSNQYVSVTLGTLAAGGSDVYMAARYNDNGDSFNANPATPCYVLELSAYGGGAWYLFEWASQNLLAYGLPYLPEAGDVWTLAVIGTTLYVIQNGSQLASVSDSTHASGLTGLGGFTATAGNVVVSNFSMGSASNTAPSSGSVPWHGPTLASTMRGVR